MPQALCHPSRQELLNRLISEAEKSQLWVRSSQSRAHTHTHTYMPCPHVPCTSPPKSLCLTLFLAAALRGGQEASHLWMSVLMPLCVGALGCWTK